MEDFQSFGLPEALLRSLKNMKFDKPTEIQAQTIPHALEGKDILGSAQTGTGKTAAFGIPLVTKIINDPKSQAIVITPTRELATQVAQALKDMVGYRSHINVALMIGGDSMNKQFRELAAKPRIFVGTPGRINDHIERGSLVLKNTNFLVLDEMDRMLDMGFSTQVEKIIKHMAKSRQTMLFSATMPDKIVKAADAYLVDPVRIAVGSTHEPVKNIKQEIMYVEDDDKYDKLVSELDNRTGSVIVFVKTKFGAERIARKLRKDDHKADAIHGDLRHNQRERVIKDFRNEQYRVLVATDVAARGLDIPHIEHVINYNLPQCPEDYIHRIGRTARAGAEGQALCFVSKAEADLWDDINCMLNPELAKERKNAPRKPSSKKHSSRRTFSRRPDDRKSDDRRSDNRMSDNRRSENRSSENRSSDDRRSDDRRPDSRRSYDDRRSDDRRAPSKFGRFSKKDGLSNASKFFDKREKRRDSRSRAAA